jgi:hypothetical protein
MALYLNIVVSPKAKYYWLFSENQIFAPDGADFLNANHSSGSRNLRVNLE